MRRILHWVLILALPGPMYAAGKAGINAREKAIDQAIHRIEAAASTACHLARRGKLTRSVNIAIASPIKGHRDRTLRFGHTTLDKDLTAALELIDEYSRARKAMPADPARPARSRPVRELTLQEKLRQAEESTKDDPAPARHRPTPDVLNTYGRQHKDAQARRDKMAEADMKSVAQERRVAESVRLAKEKADAVIQKQNARWQKELDDQATKDAALAAAWKKKRSAGAFLKNLSRAVVGGSVKAFTGGLAGGLGSGYADTIIREKFPDFVPTGEYDPNRN